MHLGHLGHEDHDGQRVDEADHDTARHEPHELGDPQRAKDDLEQAAEDDAGGQEAHAVVAVLHDDPPAGAELERLRERLDTYRKVADARCETLRARLMAAEDFAATLRKRLDTRT